MPLICCVDIYDKLQAYKIPEICDRHNRFVGLTYPFGDLSLEVIGKLTNHKIHVEDAVYVGLKARGNESITIVRDGIIREMWSDGGHIFHVVVALNDYVTPDTLFLDFFKIEVGQASKDKLVMYGGKGD